MKKYMKDAYINEVYKKHRKFFQKRKAEASAPTVRMTPKKTRCSIVPK